MRIFCTITKNCISHFLNQVPARPDSVLQTACNRPWLQQTESFQKGTQSAWNCCTIRSVNHGESSVTVIFSKSPDRINSSGLAALIALLTLSAAVSFAQPLSTGYDENTEIVVIGRVHNEDMDSYRGLRCIALQSGSRLYRVLLAPNWLVRQMGIRLQKGASIKVVGSKFYAKDGSLCLVARTMKIMSTGETIVLRDRTCRPVWLRSGSKKNSCLRIFHHRP